MNFREELEKAIGELDELFDAMKNQYADRERDYGVSIYQMMDRNGTPMVMPVVTAKANALAALANLPDESVTRSRWAACTGMSDTGQFGRHHPACKIGSTPHAAHMVIVEERT